MGMISETDPHAVAKERLNKIVADGQPCPKCGGKKSSGAEMCRKCFEDRAKNGRHEVTDEEVEAGLAEVEVAPSSKEKPEFKLALDPNEDDTGPVRLQTTDAPPPIIPALTPQSPTLEEARDAQIDGVAYGLEAFGEFPPSVVLKRIVWDDDFFMVSYETLLMILDDDMKDEEKAAVWLLLRYLKRVEKQDLMNKLMGSWVKVPEDQRKGLAKALRAVNGE